MVRNRKYRPVIPGSLRGWFSLPSEPDGAIYLNPAERTLFRLFLSHPEGIAADGLPLHWQELCDIYARESSFDDPELREDALVSLCAESKRVFYANISRIKKKFVSALGARKAAGYIIKRGKDGLYRTKACLSPPAPYP